MDYKDISDNNLALLAKKDQDALNAIIERYRILVTAIGRKYFLLGGDSDDMFQEGAFGLIRAIDTYNGSVAFKSYASVLITRSIISAIRKYSSKNKILTKTVSLYDGEDDGGVINEIKDFAENPEDNIINGESFNELISYIKSNSTELENGILELYVKGHRISEIEEITGKDKKAIDNALQRIKKKIIKYLESD